MPGIDQAVFTRFGPPHAASRCVWCRRFLVPVDPQPDGRGRLKWRFWRCPTAGCFLRCWAYVMVGKERVLFLPVPSQAVLFETVAPLDADGQILPRLCPNILLLGSRGSAKSHGLRWLCHWLAWKLPRLQMLLLRRTKPELEKSHLVHIQYEGSLLRAALSAYVLTYENESQLTFGHCAEAGDQSKYLSTAYDVIVEDEAITFLPSQLIDLSTCARPGPETPVGFLPVNLGATNACAEEGATPAAKEFLRTVYDEKVVDPELMQEYRPQDYLLLQSDLTDNPFLDTADYDANLRKLSPAKYQAWRFCDWDATTDQFFDEWRKRDDGPRRAHVMGIEEELRTQAVDRQAGVIERFASLQFSYKGTGIVLWWVALTTGAYFLEDEYVFTNTLIATVAAEMHRRHETRGIALRHVVCPDTMWNKATQTGESLVETFRAAGLHAIKAHADEIIGWNRVHALLADDPAGVPLLRVSQTSCPVTCRQLAALVGDPKQPDKLLPKQPDAAAHAIRFGAMSRPYATPIVPLYTRAVPTPGQAGRWYVDELDVPGLTAGGTLPDRRH